MSSERYRSDEDIPITSIFRDAGRNPITGLTPPISLRRDSDGQYWTGSGYQATDPGLTMTEVDAVNSAGFYEFDFAADPARESNATHTIEADGGPTASPRYKTCSVVIGGWPETTPGDVWEEPVANHTVPSTTGLAALLALYDDGEFKAVFVDPVNGVAGTTVGINGTLGNPVDNITDAQVIAAATNLDTFSISNGPVTMTVDPSPVTRIVGRDSLAAINLNNIDMSRVSFATIEVNGAANVVSGPMRASRCLMIGVTNWQGAMIECAVQGFLSLNGDAILLNCATSQPGIGAPLITVGSNRLDMRSYSGAVSLTAIGVAAQVVADFIAGGIVIDGTSGTVTVSGIVEPVIDSSGGAVTISTLGVVSRTAITESVWGLTEVELEAAGETGQLTLFGLSLRTDIDFTGNDALGWQLVVFDRADTEVARANLFDEAFARIPSSVTVQDFQQQRKAISRIDPL